jgi:hypothetical protein
LVFNSTLAQLIAWSDLGTFLYHESLNLTYELKDKCIDISPICLPSGLHKR